MKQNTIRILKSCGLAVAICGIGIYNTVHRGSSNSIDYQLKINYQAHPLASIIGSMIPGIIAGFAFYWLSRWRAKRKQKKLSSITPKEAANLLTVNFDGQCEEAINGFLSNAAAKDIQEFILNIHEQSGYVQRAKTALDVRIAENAEINNRRILYLTVVLVVLTVALLAFPFLQMITNKNHDIVKSVANDTKSSTVTQTADSEFDKCKRSAENGNAVAQLNLGDYYYNGQGVQQDYVEAAKWFRKAAEQGNTVAKFYLGILYDFGLGVPQDYEEAGKWYCKAADQGDIPTQGELAAEAGYFAHLEELFMRRNSLENVGLTGVLKRVLWGDGYHGTADEEVVKEDRIRADEGDRVAQCQLGYFYLCVACNYEEAVKWYRKAADQNNANAQVILAGCYFNGQGVAINYVEAAKWVNLASAQGNETAKKSLPIIEQKLTPEQIAEGQRLAREFQPHKESAATNSSSP